MKFLGKLFGPKRQRIDLATRFELHNTLGQGSMSNVWKATERATGEIVAVKVLDKAKMIRFESRFVGLNKPSEGEIAVSLDHPNIVRTKEFGWTGNDEMFLVMEYVDGTSLSLIVDLQNETMRRNRLSYIIQIGDGLTHFHRKNLIHRDICPRNILLTEDNQIKLIDFGLAVPCTRPFQQPGNRTGTANYMAPELIKRLTTDQRIDIFSYAVTCFEMYTKTFPWDEGLTLEAIQRHINQPPKPIVDFAPTIDPELASIIMKGLERHPDDRWQTMYKMVSAFRQVEDRLVREARQKIRQRKRAAKGEVKRDETQNQSGKAVSPEKNANSETAKASAKAEAKKPAKSKEVEEVSGLKSKRAKKVSLAKSEEAPKSARAKKRPPTD